MPAHLPVLPHGNVWHPNVHQANEQLVEIFTRGELLLALDHADPIRLQLQIERITGQVKQLLRDCQAMVGLRRWAHLCASRFAMQARLLHEASRAAHELDNNHVVRLKPVRLQRTGRPGQPRKVIDRAWLAEAVSSRRRLRITTLAKTINVSRPTVHKYLRQYRLKRRFTNLDDDELDTLVQYYKQRHPEGGQRYVMGFLQNLGLRVQRQRIADSLGRVDGLGRTFRRHAKIRRRQYRVKRPNALWHVDGHHKLIRWGIVIHAFIDGSSRVVTGARASNNNRATTVLRIFRRAVKRFGWPSRVRGDRGMENTKVALVMVMYRGPRRASFIWGTSPRNSRIERFWVEFGVRVGHYWRAFFGRLERLHNLEAGNPAHLWLLHQLFLDTLNEDVEALVGEWNWHPVSGAGGNLLPADMMFLGQTTDGIYDDELADVHPDLIEQHYGAEYSDDEANAGDNIEDVAEQVAEDQAGNVHSAPVAVPDGDSPFSTADDEAQFFEAVSELEEGDYVPELFAEVIEAGYDEHETIQYGRRGKKEIRVTLKGSSHF